MHSLAGIHAECRAVAWNCSSGLTRPSRSACRPTRRTIHQDVLAAHAFLFTPNAGPTVRDTARPWTRLLRVGRRSVVALLNTLCIQRSRVDVTHCAVAVPVATLHGALICIPIAARRGAPPCAAPMPPDSCVSIRCHCITTTQTYRECAGYCRSAFLATDSCSSAVGC